MTLSGCACGQHYRAFPHPSWFRHQFREWTGANEREAQRRYGEMVKEQALALSGDIDRRAIAQMYEALKADGVTDGRHRMEQED